MAAFLGVCQRHHGSIVGCFLAKAHQHHYDGGGWRRQPSLHTIVTMGGGVKSDPFMGRHQRRVLPEGNVGHLWFWTSFFLAGCGGWKPNPSWASIGDVFDIVPSWRRCQTTPVWWWLLPKGRVFLLFFPYSSFLRKIQYMVVFVWCLVLSSQSDRTEVMVSCGSCWCPNPTNRSGKLLMISSCRWPNPIWRSCQLSWVGPCLWPNPTGRRFKLY